MDMKTSMGFFHDQFLLTSMGQPNFFGGHIGRLRPFFSTFDVPGVQINPKDSMYSIYADQARGGWEFQMTSLGRDGSIGSKRTRAERRSGGARRASRQDGEGVMIDSLGRGPQRVLVLLTQKHESKKHMWACLFLRCPVYVWLGCST